MSFASVSAEIASHPLPVFAVGTQSQTQNCSPAPVKSGFSVGGQSRGSLVKLCAKFVVDKTAVTPKAKPKARPSIPVKSNGPIPSPLPAKVEHRRRVSNAGNMFSPSALTIKATPTEVKVRQRIEINLSNSRQYRIAYLLGRFVALRFTPLRADLSLNPLGRSEVEKTGPFSAKISFGQPGSWKVRGIVYYRADYRPNGASTWREVPGELHLAAVPETILVRTSGAEVKGVSKKRAYLVLDDCLKFEKRIGCLN